RTHLDLPHGDGVIHVGCATSHEMQVRASLWPGRISYALRISAGIYLAGIWLEAVGATSPLKMFPRSLVYFTQIAALFTRAAVYSIDYRAEAYDCAASEWAELDTR